MNWTLFSVILSIAATVLSGVFMIIALVLGMDSMVEILLAIGLGAVLAVPTAFLVTKKLATMRTN